MRVLLCCVGVDVFACEAAPPLFRSSHSGAERTLVCNSVVYFASAFASVHWAITRRGHIHEPEDPVMACTVECCGHIRCDVDHTASISASLEVIGVLWFLGKC